MALLGKIRVRGAHDLAQRAALQGVKLDLPELEEEGATSGLTEEESAKADRAMKAAMKRMEAERARGG